jgi:hypothetical protein
VPNKEPLDSPPNNLRRTHLTALGANFLLGAGIFFASFIGLDRVEAKTADDAVGSVFLPVVNREIFVLPEEKPILAAGMGGLAVMLVSGSALITEATHREE